MRVADRPIPTSIVLDDVPMLAGWPVRPVIAVQQIPVPPYTWDDGNVWDGAGLVWDAATVMPGYIDATCAFTGLEIDAGAPDEAGLFPATRCVVQLDNADGRWSRWNVDGTPADHAPGLELAVWAHGQTAPGDWWLFDGTISRWDQRADDTIEVEAFDAFSDLAQPVGTFTPGAAGDLPGARLTAILAAAGSAGLPHRFAVGVNHLTAQETDRSPLDEIEVVTASDGGAVFVDADGTLVAADRTWRNGRTDQGPWPVISDNVCTAPIIVWDPVLSTNDAHLADAVVLENVAGLRSLAGTLTGRYVLADTDQQWTSQLEGDTLAAWILAAQSTARLALDEATLYLFDPRQPNLWRAVDWRRFDRIRFLHDQRTPAGTARLDLQMLLVSLLHEITVAGGWTVTFATTRALTYLTPTFWDATLYVWDDPAPAAVWGY